MSYSLKSRTLSDLLQLRQLAYTHLAPQVKPSGSNKTQVIEDLFDLLTPAGLKQFYHLLSPIEKDLLKASLMASAPSESKLILDKAAIGQDSLLFLVMNSEGSLDLDLKPLLFEILNQRDKTIPWNSAQEPGLDSPPEAETKPQPALHNMQCVDSAEVIDCGSVQLADCLAGHPVLASLCLRAGVQWLVVLHREMAAFRIQLQKMGYYLPVTRG